MRFSFTDDQRLFAAGLRDLLGAHCTPAHVRAVWDDGSGHSPSLWKRLDDMGVLSLLVPEATGGFGGSEVDAVLLCQELGRAAVPGPVLEHIVAAPVVGPGHGVLTMQLDGPYAPHAAAADAVLRRGELLSGLHVDEVAALDGGRRVGTVSGTSTRLAFDEGLAFDRLALATAAFLVGLSEWMLETAAEHARRREQFGRPIGSFQAVKHLLANALLQVEFAKAPVYRAAWSLATGQPGASVDISTAKALANDAAYLTTRNAMQVHGGIGYTWEADLQLYMKKAWALIRSSGDTTFHRRRVTASVRG